MACTTREATTEKPSVSPGDWRNLERKKKTNIVSLDPIQEILGRREEASAERNWSFPDAWGLREEFL